MNASQCLERQDKFDTILSALDSPTLVDQECLELSNYLIQCFPSNAILDVSPKQLETLLSWLLINDQSNQEYQSDVRISITRLLTITLQCQINHSNNQDKPGAEKKEDGFLYCLYRSCPSLFVYLLDIIYVEGIQKHQFVSTNAELQESLHLTFQILSILPKKWLACLKADFQWEGFSLIDTLSSIFSLVVDSEEAKRATYPSEWQNNVTIIHKILSILDPSKAYHLAMACFASGLLRVQPPRISEANRVPLITSYEKLLFGYIKAMKIEGRNENIIRGLYPAIFREVCEPWTSHAFLCVLPSLIFSTILDATVSLRNLSERDAKEDKFGTRSLFVASLEAFCLQSRVSAFQLTTSGISYLTAPQSLISIIRSFERAIGSLLIHKTDIDSLADGVLGLILFLSNKDGPSTEDCAFTRFSGLYDIPTASQNAVLFTSLRYVYGIFTKYLGIVTSKERAVLFKSAVEATVRILRIDFNDDIQKTFIQQHASVWLIRFFEYPSSWNTLPVLFGEFNVIDDRDPLWKYSPLPAIPTTKPDENGKRSKISEDYQRRTLLEETFCKIVEGMSVVLEVCQAKISNPKYNRPRTSGAVNSKHSLKPQWHSSPHFGDLETEQDGLDVSNFLDNHNSSVTPALRNFFDNLTRHPVFGHQARTLGQIIDAIVPKESLQASDSLLETNASGILKSSTIIRSPKQRPLTVSPRRRILVGTPPSIPPIQPSVPTASHTSTKGESMPLSHPSHSLSAQSTHLTNSSSMRIHVIRKAAPPSDRPSFPSLPVTRPAHHPSSATL